MSEVRIATSRDSEIPVVGVSTNGSGGRRAPRDQPHPQRHDETGGEELAVALRESGRGRLRAHFTLDADGQALIRIVDEDRDETVAVVTPEALRELAEQTGLPSGLLVQALS
jgi:hypothetical protein